MLQQIITEYMYNRKGEFTCMSDETGNEANYKNYKSARYEGTVNFTYHSAGLALVVQMLSRCSTRDSKVSQL